MLLVAAILVFLFICSSLFAYFLIDSFFGGLDFTTRPLVVSEVVKIIKQRHLESGRFYDLGSARGNFAIKIAKALPNLQVYGIDDNWFRIGFAKARGIFLKNLNFTIQDIFKANVSLANILYIYLPQELMPNLQSKLQKELKNGAIVITNRVSFPSWQPIEKVNQLFIYQQ